MVRLHTENLLPKLVTDFGYSLCLGQAEQFSYFSLIHGQGDTFSDSPQYCSKQGKSVQVSHVSFSKLYTMWSSPRQCTFFLWMCKCERSMVLGEAEVANCLRRGVRHQILSLSISCLPLVSLTAKLSGCLGFMCSKYGSILSARRKLWIRDMWKLSVPSSLSFIKVLAGLHYLI